MIFYLVFKPFSYTINNYLTSWGKPLTNQVNILPYELLFKAKSLPTGTYIFSDIERLNPQQAEIATQVWQDLSQAGNAVRLLNHPTQSMRRYELLRTLYEHGLNKANIYKLTECRMPQNFPVFIRGENDHDGSRTSLLVSSEELEKAIQEIFQTGKSRENKVITEFCDTSDDQGIFRKYSAMIVGDKVIPRHVFFGKKWMLKAPKFLDESLILEEQKYVENNPHEVELSKIFKLARIQYGRVDYGLLNGTIQVWEINTNPMTLSDSDRTREGLHRKRIPVHDLFAQKLNSALQAIDSNSDSKTKIYTSIQQKFPQPPIAKQLIKELVLGLVPAQYQLIITKKLQPFTKLLKQRRES